MKNLAMVASSAQELSPLTVPKDFRESVKLSGMRGKNITTPVQHSSGPSASLDPMSAAYMGNPSQ
jgi:hypothetical protein